MSLTKKKKTELLDRLTAKEDLPAIVEDMAISPKDLSDFLKSDYRSFKEAIGIVDARLSHLRRRRNQMQRNIEEIDKVIEAMESKE